MRPRPFTNMDVWDVGAGTLGRNKRLFDCQFGTRNGGVGGMFTDLHTFNYLEISAGGVALAVYPNGSYTAAGAHAGSIRVQPWGTHTFPLGVHIAKGSLLITNPNAATGSFRWWGFGW